MSRETTSVRAGEEISVENLSRYLESQSKLPAGELCIEQFPAGSSNLTYLVRTGSDEFVLRRPPFGNTVKPELERAIEWLSENIPVESDAPLVHNDYKFDNVMLDPHDLTKITAVLDWRW